MSEYIKKFSIITLLFLLSSINSYAISHAVKSQKDYIYLLDNIRKINIMIENFNTKDAKKDYDEIRTLFSEASKQHFGRNYVVSATKFKAIKFKMIDFLEKLSKFYLHRTKIIMDSTAKKSMQILIKYSKKSGMAAYFRKAYDPNASYFHQSDTNKNKSVYEKKIYDVKKYKYFHYRSKIENYLKSGYEKYHTAQKVFNNKNIFYIKQRKAKTMQGLNYIINQYLKVIYLCRTSKQYGLEIHKLLNHHMIGSILRKYQIKQSSLSPIFDDRIPDAYKVDANDNLSFIHSKELILFKDRVGKEHPSAKMKIDDTSSKKNKDDNK